MTNKKVAKKDLDKKKQESNPKKVVSQIQEPVKKASSIKPMFVYAIIFLFASALYANTVVNDYALDDSIVIRFNRFAQKGFAGLKEIFMYDSFKGFDESYVNSVSGGRYRPLSIATFAIEKQFWGENPHISHVINIVLYALTCVLLYYLLQRFLEIKLKQTHWYNTVPFLATLLFAAHPIHTEVVANIKSRDEILALLFSFLTLLMLIKYFDTKKILYAVASPILFFLALLSKEIAVVFVLIFPLMFYYFTTIDIRKIIIAMIPVAVVTLLFIVIRHVVLSATVENPNIVKNITNYSFAEMNVFQRYATIVYTLGLYVKLIFIPHPLTWDYYPYHIAIKEWKDASVIISLLVYIGLLFIAIRGLKRRTILSFCILVFLIPLSMTANILFPVGTFMCERFLYISSIGFAVIIAYVISEKPAKYLQKVFSKPLLIILPILCLFGFKTIDRNKDWKDDDTLIATDVKVSKNSMRSTCEYGGFMYTKGEKATDDGERIMYYNQALEYEERAFNICKDLSKANFIIGTLTAKFKNDPQHAIFYLINASKLDPKNIDSYNNLGIAYCMTNQPDKAINTFNEALIVAPNNVNILRNLSILYRNLGQQTKSDVYAAKCKELEQMVGK